MGYVCIASVAFVLLGTSMESRSVFWQGSARIVAPGIIHTSQGIMILLSDAASDDKNPIK